MSDITFIGGAIGMVAGNQQYTFRDLKFRGCRTAIQMIWNWGMTASRLDIQGADIGINASNYDSSTRDKMGRPKVPQGVAVNSPSIKHEANPRVCDRFRLHNCGEKTSHTNPSPESRLES
jgi:hypothetical protein